MGIVASVAIATSFVTFDTDFAITEMKVFLTWIVRGWKKSLAIAVVDGDAVSAAAAVNLEGSQGLHLKFHANFETTRH